MIHIIILFIQNCSESQITFIRVVRFVSIKNTFLRSSSSQPDFGRMLHLDVMIQLNLIGQYFPAGPARHSSPVDLLQVVVPRVPANDLNPTDRAEMILVVKAMNLKTFLWRN